MAKDMNMPTPFVEARLVKMATDLASQCAPDVANTIENLGALSHAGVGVHKARDIGLTRTGNEFIGIVERRKKEG